MLSLRAGLAAGGFALDLDLDFDLDLDLALGKPGNKSGII